MSDDSSARPDEAMTSRIKDHHRNYQGHEKGRLAEAVAGGRLLKQEKERLGRGKFGPWVKGDCGIPLSTANRWILLADKCPTD